LTTMPNFIFTPSQVVRHKTNRGMWVRKIANNLQLALCIVKESGIIVNNLEK
jgi:hypothetical protein